MIRFIDKRTIFAAVITVIVLSAGNGDSDVPETEPTKIIGKVNVSGYMIHRLFHLV